MEPRARGTDHSNCACSSARYFRSQPITCPRACFETHMVSSILLARSVRGASPCSIAAASSVRRVVSNTGRSARLAPSISTTSCCAGFNSTGVSMPCTLAHLSRFECHTGMTAWESCKPRRSSLPQRPVRWVKRRDCVGSSYPVFAHRQELRECNEPSGAAAVCRR